MNDLENIPFAIAIFWASFLVTDGNTMSPYIIWSSIAYTISRILYVIMYGFAI